MKFVVGICRRTQKGGWRAVLALFSRELHAVADAPRSLFLMWTLPL